MTTSYSVPTVDRSSAGYRGTQPLPEAPPCDCTEGARYCGPAEGIAFYVTAAKPGAVAMVAGPYRDHAEAMAAYRTVRDEAERLDPRATWYTFGTARGKAGLGTVLGRLYGPRD